MIGGAVARVSRAKESSGDVNGGLNEEPGSAGGGDKGYRREWNQRWRCGVTMFEDGGGERGWGVTIVSCPPLRWFFVLSTIQQSGAPEVVYSGMRSDLFTLFLHRRVAAELDCGVRLRRQALRGSRSRVGRRCLRYDAFSLLF